MHYSRPHTVTGPITTHTVTGPITTHTVTGPITTAPAHSARPLPRFTARLVAFVTAALVAVGLGIAARDSTGSPVHSTPSSAHHMKRDAADS